MTEALLSARGVVVRYGRGAPVLHGVDLEIARGETVGLVGESGSGKTTLGRALLRLIDVAAGSIRFDGTDITHLPEGRLRPLRRRMQMIFQDPMASLNPRHTVRRSLTAPLLLHRIATGRAEATARIASVLDRVALPRDCLDRYPHQLSGGQRQRVGIARAVAVAPALIVADEIVSGLDVSTQAEVLIVLRGLTRDLGVALAFISHDLSVVRAVCDRVVVMRAGRVVEDGGCAAVFAAPRDPYTRALIDAIPPPRADPDWLRLL